MPERIDEALLDRIALQMAARQLTVARCPGTFNMIHPDAKIRREGLRRLEVIAAAARPLGTRGGHALHRHPATRRTCGGRTRTTRRPKRGATSRQSLDAALEIAELGTA